MSSSTKKCSLCGISGHTRSTCPNQSINTPNVVSIWNEETLQKIENLSIKPKKLEKAPPSLMIAKSKTYYVGVKGNMIPKSLVFVEQKSNNQSGLGSMFTAGPGKQINEVPTVYATNKVSIKKFTPGFKTQ